MTSATIASTSWLRLEPRRCRPHGLSRIASALEVLRSQQLSLAESRIALLQLMSDEKSTANDRELIEQHLQMLSLVEDELAGDARTQQ